MNGDNGNHSMEVEVSDFGEEEIFGFGEGDGEENFALGISGGLDAAFDEVIGAIEEVIMHDEFQQTQRDFMEKYYHEFDDSEENKFVYTEIHQAYVDTIEKLLETQLKEMLPDFDMQLFLQLLSSRKEELDGEVFDMLMTFTDFVQFKELLLDYKAEREGQSVDFSMGFIITPVTQEPQ